MSSIKLCARRGAIAGGLGSLALMAALAAPAWAGQVPASSTVRVAPISSSASAARSSGRHVYQQRVRDPQRYAAQKAAADAAYRRWVTTHPFSTLGPLGSPSLNIVKLNKPGLGAQEAGGSTPPDTTGAIGPNFYIEFVNSEIAVYSRTTLASPPVAHASEDSFTGATSTCDGQIKWDQSANRWVYWSLDCGQGGPNGYSFGYSKTNNPSNLSTGWCKYHVPTGGALEDYGKLGTYNGAWIVGANEFNTANSESIIGIPKPPAGPGCANVTVKTFHPQNAVNFTPEPANIFGSSATGYIVASDPATPSNLLHIYRMTGSTAATLTLSSGSDISVAGYDVPAGVPQPGSTDQIDSSDTRLTQANAVVDPKTHKFGIWTQHTVAGPGGSGSVVRWYELQDGKATSVQTGTISPAGGGANFAFNGAISPTIDGNAAAVNYNLGGPNILVSLRARIHAAGAAPGATSSDSLLGNSNGIDVDFSCPSAGGTGATCRWGDYAGASFDPSVHTAVWGTGELNGTPDTVNNSAEWKSRNFELVVK